jgi:hypothetical protein
MMEAASGARAESIQEAPAAEFRSRVILALDQFTPDAHAAVEQAVRSFMCGDAPATRLPDHEPFHLLRATPDLLVIVRYATGGPALVEDIVTQATWDYLVHAR